MEALSHEKELQKTGVWWPEDIIESELLKKQFSISNGIAFPFGYPGVVYYSTGKNGKIQSTLTQFPDKFYDHN